MGKLYHTSAQKLIEKFDAQLRDILVADIKLAKHNNQKAINRNFTAFIRHII